MINNPGEWTHLKDLVGDRASLSSVNVMMFFTFGERY
jgi:hypothetical protein